MYTDIEEENQELALLNAHSDSLKKQIAERDARKQEAMNAQPKTRVGWASYIIDNDRGLLDKYADAERAWQVAKKQNEYATQLADKQNEHAMQLADKQNEHAMQLADKQRAEQRAINLNEARDTLAKLQIMKDTAVQQGHDTREIELQMASVYRDYPELLSVKVKEEEYDPRSSVEYVLADVEDIDDNNTQEEINEAIERVAKYKTSDSVKMLNKLEKILAKRIKKEGDEATYDNEINAWINGGDTTKYLYNLGLETEFAGDKERLVSKKTGKVVAERPRNKSRPTPKSKPSKSKWEL